jgi:hypothetical protein
VLYPLISVRNILVVPKINNLQVPDDFIRCVNDVVSKQAAVLTKVFVGDLVSKVQICDMKPDQYFRENHAIFKEFRQLLAEDAKKVQSNIRQFLSHKGLAQYYKR